MFVHQPKMAKRWAAHTKNGAKLPKKVKEAAPVRGGMKWDEFKKKQPELAKTWEKDADDLRIDPHQITWTMKDNGAVEGIPNPGTPAEQHGTEIYNPIKKQWGNSDYVDESWIEQALGHGRNSQGPIQTSSFGSRKDLKNGVDHATEDERTGHEGFETLDYDASRLKESSSPGFEEFWQNSEFPDTDEGFDNAFKRYLGLYPADLDSIENDLATADRELDDDLESIRTLVGIPGRGPIKMSDKQFDKLMKHTKKMSEMPHLDADVDIHGKPVTVVDLRVERYPMPREEQQRLFRAFAKTGLVGELDGELFHFKPDHTIDVIDQADARKLPRLPKGWDKVMVTEAHIGNKFVHDEEEAMLSPAALAGPDEPPKMVQVFIREKNDGTIPEKDKNKHLPDPKEAGDKFVKTDVTHAIKIDKPFTVETIEGEAEAKEGDFLCKGTEGDMWPVDQEIFAKTYKPIAPKMEKVFKRK